MATETEGKRNYVNCPTPQRTSIKYKCKIVRPVGFRVCFLFVTGLVILLAGCKSKNAACQKCPYELGASNIRIEQKEIPYLKFDSLCANINKILPSEPFCISQLSKSVNNPLLPLYKNVVGEAFSYKGVRYRRGGTSLKGMDCSGLVYTCYSTYGISLPRSSADMAKSVHDITREEAQIGDLIFFKTNRRHGRINHVGLVIEANNGEIKFIHASLKKGVTISSTQESYYAKTFAKVGRI